ncbi:MAG: DUF1232 domain-containing protein [Polyangiaceae bacterium]|jgi:uncharacterized membrane protein YkvA (DUF1232 family)
MTEESNTLSKYLEIFPSWLKSLGEDAAELGEVVKGSAPEGARRQAVAGLNYIFKSLDLIPDGIDDLGFCDDAFVLRVAADLACAEFPEAKAGVLGRLADDAVHVRDFLGDDYVRLESYVKNLRKGAARGRTVDDIVGDESARTAFLHEVSAWSRDYQVPSFSRDVKTLIKLKAFLSAKLA